MCEERKYFVFYGFIVCDILMGEYVLYLLFWIEILIGLISWNMKWNIDEKDIRSDNDIKSDNVSVFIYYLWVEVEWKVRSYI